MLTRTCPRCEGTGAEPDKEAPCLGCKGSGKVEVSDEPVTYPPPNNDGLMKIDPPPDPEKKAARKRAMEPCGKCACCRRWKAKSHYAAKGSRVAFSNAQKWADYWKKQYESLSAAQKKDHHA